MTNGTEKEELQSKIIYFQMAKIFGFKPNEVDEIDNELILGMLSMEAKTRKKESELINKNGKRN